jgi:hypothetical protein
LRRRDRISGSSKPPAIRCASPSPDIAAQCSGRQRMTWHLRNEDHPLPGNRYKVSVRPMACEARLFHGWTGRVPAASEILGATLQHGYRVVEKRLTAAQTEEVTGFGFSIPRGRPRAAKKRGFLRDPSSLVCHPRSS